MMSFIHKFKLTNLKPINNRLLKAAVITKHYIIGSYSIKPF